MVLGQLDSFKKLDHFLKMMKLDLYLKPYTRVTSKWIRDANIKKWNYTVLEENMGKFLYNVGLWKGFLTMTENSDIVKN